jgi:hypothetical protein
MIISIGKRLVQARENSLKGWKLENAELSKAEGVGMADVEAKVKKAIDESARFLAVVNYN